MVPPVQKLSRMIQLSAVLTIILCSTGPGAADSRQTLSWEALLAPERSQLMQESTELRNRFVKLPKPDQRYYLAITQALEVKKQIDNGLTSHEDLQDWEREILESGIIDQHPEVLALWEDQTELDEKLQASGDSVARQLDGKLVEIPGVVLPINATANPVTEFIFVPDLSVFEQLPSPPANQVIHVTFADGLDQQQIDKPIWLLGTLTTSGGRHIVDYENEDRPVNAAYSLTASDTRPYVP